LEWTVRTAADIDVR